MNALLGALSQTQTLMLCSFSLKHERLQKAITRYAFPLQNIISSYSLSYRSMNFAVCTQLFHAINTDGLLSRKRLSLVINSIVMPSFRQQKLFESNNKFHLRTKM